MIALYERVSRGDGTAGASGSVSGQALMLADRARSLFGGGEGAPAFRHFTDDGYSGLTLKRPALRQMLELCRAREVECVMVSDLSRLSRSYLDVGFLTERVFPAAGVRFVSVAEGIDIAPGAPADGIAGFERALRGVANNAYSLMLSRSVRAAMRACWEAGDHVQAFAPFGYVYDRSARGHLRVDRVAAPWVADMFRRAAAGQPPAQIARALRSAGVPTPAEYAKAQGGPKAGCYGDDPGPWDARKVRRVLAREAYAGVLVGGATRGVGVGRGSPRRVTGADERVRVAGAHEPIVSRALFDAAQEAIARVRPGRPRRA